jgi:DnaJ family protein B protein 4
LFVAGTKITFPNEGDEKPGYIAADLCFTLEEVAHDRFSRDGNDLVYTHRLLLKDALLRNESTVELVHLDGRTLQVDVGSCDMLAPDACVLVRGEGFPSHKADAPSGDLKVKFRPMLPRQLSDEKRREMVALLDEFEQSTMEVDTNNEQ